MLISVWMVVVAVAVIAVLIAVVVMLVRQNRELAAGLKDLRDETAILCLRDDSGNFLPLSTIQEVPGTGSGSDFDREFALAVNAVVVQYRGDGCWRLYKPGWPAGRGEEPVVLHWTQPSTR